MNRYTGLKIAVVAALIAAPPAQANNIPSWVKENLSARKQMEWMMQRDPATNTISPTAWSRAVNFATTQSAKQNTGASSIASQDWQSYGPINVGGRTRSVVWDRRNPQVMMAGGVSGGLWRSVDGGQSWAMTSRPEQMPPVTSIIQHPDPAQSDTWFFATGEGFGSAGHGPGGANNISPRHPGNGIYKSTDNGVTWDVIPSTAPSPSLVFDRFSYVHNIAAERVGSQTVLYAACAGGIMRSTDEGASWTSVIGRDPRNYASDNVPAFTEIHIAADGTKYAGISAMTLSDTQLVDFFRSYSGAGIWRSTDGVNWTDVSPAEFQQGFGLGRITLATAPSNPSVLYTAAVFVVHQQAVLNVLMLKSTAKGDNWNTCGGLPQPTGSQSFAGANPQFGYNFCLAVSPTDPNKVVFGTTNLLASTDGFASEENTLWVSGYNPFIDPSVIEQSLYESWEQLLYPNGGWDHHHLAFHPSAPNALVTGSDGGVRFSPDVFTTADTVTWRALNTGYLTSQFYTVAINERKAGDMRVMGGMQDNSTYGTSDASKPWQFLTGGDGCHAAFVSDSVAITSSQGGSFHKVVAPEGFAPAAMRRSTFASAPSNKFLVPIEADPFTSTRAWVMSDDGIVGFDEIYGNEDAGAEALRVTDYLSLAEDFTAFSVSKTKPFTFFVGSSDGRIVRCSLDSTSGSAQVADLTKSNMPGAYTACIAVDPADDNHLVAVYSNYNVPSLWETLDGGSTWRNVSGTIEQNPDGSGDGPSCRWLTITRHGGQLKYYLGTNVGLYSATALVPGSTQWQREAESTLGAAVVTMIRARESDGFVAVATHGSGVWIKNPSTSVADTEVQIPLYAGVPSPNPASDWVSIPLAGTVGSGKVQAEIYDVRGSVVGAVGQIDTSTPQSVRVNVSALGTGTYFARLSVGSQVITVPFAVAR